MWLRRAVRVAEEDAGAWERGRGRKGSGVGWRVGRGRGEMVRRRLELAHAQELKSRNHCGLGSVFFFENGDCAAERGSREV